jgi:hypothetical protein
MNNRLDKMSIVASEYLIKKFSTIKEYELDLGIATYIDDSGKKSDGRYVSSKWVVKDDVVRLYMDIQQNIIKKVGKIGILSFYVDYYNEDQNTFYIIKDNKMYKLEYDNSNNIRHFLSKSLSDVINGKINIYTKADIKDEKEVDIKYMTRDELIEYLRNNNG